MSKGKILVKQVRSEIGRSAEFRLALRALGLGKIGKQREFTMSPAIAGMLRRVENVIEVSKK